MKIKQNNSSKMIGITHYTYLSSDNLPKIDNKTSILHKMKTPKKTKHFKQLSLSTNRLSNYNSIYSNFSLNSLRKTSDTLSVYNSQKYKAYFLPKKDSSLNIHKKIMTDFKEVKIKKYFDRIEKENQKEVKVFRKSPKKCKLIKKCFDIEKEYEEYDMDSDMENTIKEEYSNAVKFLSPNKYTFKFSNPRRKMESRKNLNRITKPILALDKATCFLPHQEPMFTINGRQSKAFLLKDPVILDELIQKDVFSNRTMQYAPIKDKKT